MTDKFVQQRQFQTRIEITLTILRVSCNCGFCTFIRLKTILNGILRDFSFFLANSNDKSQVLKRIKGVNIYENYKNFKDVLDISWMMAISIRYKRYFFIWMPPLYRDSLLHDSSDNIEEPCDTYSLLFW